VRAHEIGDNVVTTGYRTRTRRRALARASAVLAIVLVASLAVGCGGNASEATDAATSTADLTGFWEFAGEQSLAPVPMIRVTSTADGYLVEPSSWEGISWSQVSQDGDALTTTTTGPGGETFLVRLEPAAHGAKLTISPASGDGQPIYSADLARPSGDYADLAAQFETSLEQGRRTAVKEGIRTLQIGVQSWLVDHNDTWPPVDVVQPGGSLKTYLDAWPENPYTGGPMEPGKDPGQYTYERLDSGRSYRLTGHFEGGGDFTVP
jgi:hypothetical protein